MLTAGGQLTRGKDKIFKKPGIHTQIIPYIKYQTQTHTLYLVQKYQTHPHTQYLSYEAPHTNQHTLQRKINETLKEAQGRIPL